MFLTYPVFRNHLGVAQLTFIMVKASRHNTHTSPNNPRAHTVRRLFPPSPCVGTHAISRRTRHVFTTVRHCTPKHNETMRISTSYTLTRGRNTRPHATAPPPLPMRDLCEHVTPGSVRKLCPPLTRHCSRSGPPRDVTAHRENESSMPYLLRRSPTHVCLLFTNKQPRSEIRPRSSCLTLPPPRASHPHFLPPPPCLPAPKSALRFSALRSSSPCFVDRITRRRRPRLHHRRRLPHRRYPAPGHGVHDV